MMQHDSAQADAAKSSRTLWIVALGVINLCSLVAAFTLPFLLPHKSDGFAAAAEALMLFLGSLAIAVLASVAGLVLGLCWRKALPLKLKVLAFSLLPITLAAFGVFVALAMMRVYN